MITLSLKLNNEQAVTEKEVSQSRFGTPSVIPHLGTSTLNKKMINKERSPSRFMKPSKLERGPTKSQVCAFEQSTEWFRWRDRATATLECKFEVVGRRSLG